MPDNNARKSPPASIGSRLSTIARARRLMLLKKDEATNIPPKTGLLLCSLLHEDGCSQDELASRVFLDKATVARDLRILEKKGFVTRQEAPHNRRMKLVHATETARRAAPAMRLAVQEVDSRLLEGLTEEDVARLTDLLTLVEQNARKLHES